MLRTSARSLEHFHKSHTLLLCTIPLLPRLRFVIPSPAAADSAAGGGEESAVRFSFSRYVIRGIALGAIFVWALLFAPPILAFNVPLSSEAVRDAYFFGQRGDQELTDFLNQYVHNLPLPEKGPYISRIQLLTPYAQVVDVSRQNTMGYSAQQAAEDYRKRGDTIVVRIRIEFTATYNSVISVRNKNASGAEWQSHVRPQDFWRDFRIGLWQDDHWIDPLDVRGEPIYGLPDSYGNDTWIGAMVYLTFDANDVASRKADVKVFTPDGQQVASTFDLASLR